jgi:radical SAM superfamily enzyme YgiQ (UPF0313 family)
MVMYRPPFESGSFLLEVTRGCSHNRCSFCSMYRDVPFEVLPEDEVVRQLRARTALRPRTRRVFLENGDPFTLSAVRLLRIAELVRKYLPVVNTIAMYASVKNVATKTDAELRALAEAGIDDLNIGIETGYDPALAHMNKGYTAAEARRQLLRLNAAGIHWGANIILGIAGEGFGRQNAHATVELLNATQPNLIFTGTIHTEPDCPLHAEMQSGAFVEPTLGEYLDEEEDLLSDLNMDDCLLFGLHPSNIVLLEGRLNKDREKLLAKLRATREEYADELGMRPLRGAEGMVGF